MQYSKLGSRYFSNCVGFALHLRMVHEQVTRSAVLNWIFRCSVHCHNTVHHWSIGWPRHNDVTRFRALSRPIECIALSGRFRCGGSLRVGIATRTATVLRLRTSCATSSAERWNWIIFIFFCRSHMQRTIISARWAWYAYTRSVYMGLRLNQLVRVRSPFALCLRKQRRSSSANALRTWHSDLRLRSILAQRRGTPFHSVCSVAPIEVAFNKCVISDRQLLAAAALTPVAVTEYIYPLGCLS